MSTATDLRRLAQEARVIIERSLDDAEIMKGLREAATAKGIDWSQLKSLVKAQAQDDRDDGDRVEKLVAKAEFASAYADMLRANMNENDETRSSSAEPSRPAPIIPRPVEIDLEIPTALDRRHARAS